MDRTTSSCRTRRMSSQDDLGTLQPEVRDWEPEQALVGHGVTEQIARRAREVLRANGALVIEVADGTAQVVADLLAELGFADVVPRRTLRGAIVWWRAGGRRSGAAGGAARRAAHGHGLRALRRCRVGGRRAEHALSLKGRPEGQPAALLCADVERVARARAGVPEAVVRGLLPGRVHARLRKSRRAAIPGSPKRRSACACRRCLRPPPRPCAQSAR